MARAGDALAAQEERRQGLEGPGGAGGAEGQPAYPPRAAVQPALAQQAGRLPRAGGPGVDETHLRAQQPGYGRAHHRGHRRSPDHRK